MKTTRKIVTRLRDMSTPTYIFLKSCLIISCVLLFASLGTLLFGSSFALSNYHVQSLAKELWSMPQGILLIAAIGSVCIEERTMK